MATRIPTQDEIEAMAPTEFKVLENRLRRAADRQGLRLAKSHRRDPRAADYGQYWLMDDKNWPIAGGQSGMFLSEVADFLWGEAGPFPDQLALGKRQPATFSQDAAVFTPVVQHKRAV